MTVHIEAKRALFPLVILTLLSNYILVLPVAAQERWSVVEYEGGTGVGWFDDQKAETYLLREVLLVGDTSIVFGDTCFNSLVTTFTRNSFDYLYSEFGETDSSILPQDSVVVTSIRCSNEPSSSNADSLNFNFDIIRLSSKKVVVPLGGMFFFLEPRKL